MKALNRSAISVIGNQPFLEWVNYNCMQGQEPLTLDELNSDITIYLIDEIYDFEEELTPYLRRNFTGFFEAELESWTDDESLWPDDLSFKRFQSYFTVIPHSLITDHGEDELQIEKIEA